jgi:hypothetical protein
MSQRKTETIAARRARELTVSAARHSLPTAKQQGEVSP